MTAQRVSIPKPIRQAYETTDDAMHRLRGLNLAILMLMESPGVLETSRAEAEAVLVLLQEAESKLLEIARLRTIEWAALGEHAECKAREEIFAVVGKQ